MKQASLIAPKQNMSPSSSASKRSRAPEHVKSVHTPAAQSSPMAPGGPNPYTMASYYGGPMGGPPGMMHPSMYGFAPPPPDSSSAAQHYYAQQEAMIAQMQGQMMQGMPIGIPMNQFHQMEANRQSQQYDRTDSQYDGANGSSGANGGNQAARSEDGDDDGMGDEGLDDGHVERLDEKTEAAMRLQLDKFLKDLHRCNAETEGLGACERKKIRNRKASRVSRLKKKLNVYDLQRNYNAAQLTLTSQQRMIEDLKESLSNASMNLLKHDPHYVCDKFDLNSLVRERKLIPKGMDREVEVKYPPVHTKLPLKMTPRNNSNPESTSQNRDEVQDAKRIKTENSGAAGGNTDATARTLLALASLSGGGEGKGGGAPERSNTK